jgi:hypothetical protein
MRPGYNDNSGTTIRQCSIYGMLNQRRIPIHGGLLCPAKPR